MPSSSSDAVVVATCLSKSFGDVSAVRDVSLSVRAGQVQAVLGPNGAGKTTMVNLLTTLADLDGGTASVGGFDVRTQARQVRQVIGLAGQAAAVDEKLTARENLELFGRLCKVPLPERRRRTGELLERFDMLEFADRVASTYSGGQRRRLDVVAALVGAPPAIFLDEPTTGLDPRSRAELWRAVGELADQGAAILLTTQYLEEADRLADDVLILDHGTEVASGTPEALKRGLKRDVLELHLDDPSRLSAALDLLGPAADVAADPDEARIRVPVGDDAARALDLLRRMQDNGIAISDFQLRRPTLDDVFLTFTASTTPPQEASA